MAIKVTVVPLDIDPDSKPLILDFDKDEITIGRLPSNDVVLNRPEISGIHARIRTEPGSTGDQTKLYITDLGSANGTLVEKNPLKPRMEVAMLSNERIFIGNYVIKTTLHFAEAFDSEYSEDFDDGGEEVSRKNYLSEALKEFEEGKRHQEDVREIEDSIDRFAEERAVGNGPSSGRTDFLSSLMDKASSREKTVTDSSLLSVSAMFGREQSAQAPVAPFGERPYRANIEEDEEDQSEEDRTSKEFSSPVSNEGSRESYSSERNFSSDKKNDVAEDEPSYANPEEFNRKRSIASDFEPSKVVDALKIKVKVDGSDVSSFNFTAAAYTKLKGKILHKGQPLSGVTLKSDKLGTVTSNSDGSFEFSRVLEGTSYRIHLEKEKFVFNPDGFEGSADINSGLLKASATELFSISGVIKHQGQALEGVVVDGGELGKVITGPDGVYRFENVPEGKEYDLTLSKEGYAFLK